MLRVAGFAGLVIVLGMPFAAHASPYGMQEMQRWTASDRCIAAAQKAFPDYTPESLAKRDQSMKQCLASGLLPPRAPEAPQTIPSR
jgi:hypothetical protein